MAVYILCALHDGFTSLAYAFQQTHYGLRILIHRSLFLLFVEKHVNGFNLVRQVGYLLFGKHSSTKNDSIFGSQAFKFFFLLINNLRSINRPRHPCAGINSGVPLIDKRFLLLESFALNYGNSFAQSIGGISGLFKQTLVCVYPVLLVFILLLCLSYFFLLTFKFSHTAGPLLYLLVGQSVHAVHDKFGFGPLLLP